MQIILEPERTAFASCVFILLCPSAQWCCVLAACLPLAGWCLSSVCVVRMPRRGVLGSHSVCVCVCVCRRCRPPKTAHISPQTPAHCFAHTPPQLSALVASVYAVARLNHCCLPPSPIGAPPSVIHVTPASSPHRSQCALPLLVVAALAHCGRQGARSSVVYALPCSTG
jgi:hypothetical protein